MPVQTSTRDMVATYLEARCAARRHHTRYQYDQAKSESRRASRAYANADSSTWPELTRAKEWFEANQWCMWEDEALRNLYPATEATPVPDVTAADPVVEIASPQAELVAVYRAATARAEAMVPGAQFVGAMPEADAAGYDRKSLHHRLYITAFLSRLTELYPHGVRVDQNAVIVG